MLKREYEGGHEIKNQRGKEGRWIEILSTATSTQILNHKTTPPPQKKKKKMNKQIKQHSKQSKAGEVERN